MSKLLAWGMVFLAPMSAFAQQGDEYVWALPRGFPEPVVPKDNPMSRAKVRLGRRLFTDKRLSRTGTVSCATCHDPAVAFTDGQARSTGALGDQLQLNSPTLWNVAYAASLGWTETGASTLEQQHLMPLTNDAPVEMGLQPLQLAQLWKDESLRLAVQGAFGEVSELRIEHLTYAIASYVRTLIRGDSALDKYLFDDDAQGFTQQQRDGLELFLSPRLNCTACHRGVLLSGPTVSQTARFEPSFYNTGVASGAASFRAPSLRFVGQTAPYMHDGSMTSLEEVVRFYEQGGGGNAEHLKPFRLTPSSRGALVAFLLSL